MDSVINGEVTEECLSKTKVKGFEKGLTDSKTTNESIDSSEESEPLQIEALNPKSAGVLEKSSLSDPDNVVVSENQECSNREENLSQPETTTESKSSESPSIKIDPKDTFPGEISKSPTTKENGISDSEQLPNASSNAKSKNLNDIPDEPRKGSLQKLANVESTSPKLKKSSSDSEDSTKGSKSDLDSPVSSCTKNADKENVDTSVCLIVEDTIVDEQIPETSDLKIIKDDSIEGKKTDINTSTNHFMAGGSIISSNEDQENKTSKIIDVDKITDLSKKTPEVPKPEDCCKDSEVNNTADSNEQPLNFIMSKKMEQSLSNKDIESTLNLSSSKTDGLVDLSVDKQSQENSSDKTNPLQKLNEHLKSIGLDNAIHNHTQKGDNDSALSTSSPVIVAQIPDAHVNCDKENKCTDSSHPQERLSKELSDSFVFADLSNEETGFPDAFTGLVTIGKYISVKGDFTLRSSEALVESPSLVAPYLLKEPDSFPPKDKDSKSEMKDFFHSAAGEILIGIGLSRVNEWFHRDMVRIKKRHLKKNATPELEEDLAMHETCYSEAKKANSVYSFNFKVCKTCGFTTESSIILEGHLLVPHITQRREYQCNFCDVINRDPKAMLEHMQKIHRKIGRIQPPVLFFECPYCTFESNSKVKLNNHLVKCQRYFDHGINQAPPKDFEFPALTPKPITVAVVKAYEKSLGSMQRGRGRPKKDLSESMHMNQFSPTANLAPLAPTFRASSNSPLTDSLSIQNQIPAIQLPNMNLRPAHNSMGQLRPGISAMHMPAPNRFFGVVNPTGQLMPLMGNNHLVTSPSQFPFSSNLDNSGGKKTSSSAAYFNTMFGSGLRQQNSSKGMSSVTITPLPKLTGPYPVPAAKPTTASGGASMQSNSLVVCEICDGYIKDLEQLRTHMQLIHKVKIHPKMLVSRPPLNCQKCQWRFFTDQGLERHLLGAHGLVTSNMQELANKGKDAGCCTICGRVYASKLVSHMNQVHKVTLKPAHLSYKCTVCSATFNLYRLFENHVYLVHSGAAKRSADGRSSPSKKLKTLGDSLTGSESLNHKDKRSSADIGDENAKMCKECGIDMSNDKKSQSDKCEKCLKSDELVQGTLSTKTIRDELKKKDKAIEKAAA